MLVIKDFATTTIASALTAAATSIVVSDASRLPALSAGDHFDLVLQKFTDRNYVEIVRVTGVSGNTLTVARGRDGTMGRAFSIGDYAEVRLTVGVFSTYVSQLVEGKVDKDFSYVNQRLQVVNTGDLVGASLALLYAAGTGHGTIVSGGEGVNKQTPYVALRPLGHANAATQMKYTYDGSLSLVGGTRSASFGFVLSEHSFDSNGFPNAVSSDANNYINRARSKITAGNSGLHFLADAALDARRFGIQSGHSSAMNAASYGILDLNPFGGLVRVNGGTVYHTGYMPTPAALGVLALSGGIMTGDIQSGATYRTTINQSLGFIMQRPGFSQPVGLGQGSEGHAVVGYGPENAPLAYLKVGPNALFADLGNGIKNIYHEDYLPSPAIIGAVPTSRTVNGKPLSANVVLSAADIGAVPQARTINTKPLTADVVLSAADVGAAPTGYGLGGHGASIPSNDLNTGLRTASGFYNGYLAANRPAWPVSGTNAWDYVFNIAHGGANGYNGMLAMDFNGRGLAFKTIAAGADSGWKYVYHSGYLPPASVGSAPNPIELGGTEHLDNLKTPNIYSQSANANTSTSRGYPEALAGALHVYRGAGVTQVYYVYSTSRVWTRSFVSAWSPWALQFNSQNLPTASDVGAVPQARTINGKPLTANVVLSAADIGAVACDASGIVNQVVDFKACRGIFTGASGAPLELGHGESTPKTFYVDIHTDTAADFNHRWTYAHGGPGVHFSGSGDFADIYIRSDKRLKTNLAKIAGSLDKVRRLTGYEFDKAASLGSDVVHREVGLLADDVQAVLPYAVRESSDEDAIKTLSPSALIALLVEAIKELTDRVKYLESKIN